MVPFYRSAVTPRARRSGLSLHEFFACVVLVGGATSETNVAADRATRPQKDLSPAARHSACGRHAGGSVLGTCERVSNGTLSAALLAGIGQTKSLSPSVRKS